MTASLRDWQGRFPATSLEDLAASATLSFHTGRRGDEAETCLFSGKLGYCTCFKQPSTIMAWWRPHARCYESDSSCIGSLTLMTLHWCITRSDMLMATWWNISGDDAVLNIWKDVLTKWTHGRRGVGGCHVNIIISAEGNYSLPSSLTYLCCPCLTVYALFVFTALVSTRV